MSPASPVPAVVLLVAPGAEPGGDHALWRQRRPPLLVLALGPQAPPPGEEPRVRRAAHWNDALDERGAFVWLCDGTEPVAEDFLGHAAEALTQEREASFVVAAAPGDAAGPADLAEILGGSGIGAAILFRSSALQTVGGIDEAAASAAAASWDLAIRLAEAGHEWRRISAAAPGAGLAQRLGEPAARWLYRKHARLYGRHLQRVLLDRERDVARLRRRNAERRTELDGELRPLLAARCRERDRLMARLAAAPRPRSGVWGDFRRLEPLYRADRDPGAAAVDRHYVERFLRRHAGALRGDVLTVRGGLGAIPSESQDCVVIDRALQAAARPAQLLAGCRRILRPGGTLLASALTAAGPDAPEEGERWRFSAAYLRELLAAAGFAPAAIEVRAEGNRRALLAFLVGMRAGELEPSVLEADDPLAPVVITARAAVLAR